MSNLPRLGAHLLVASTLVLGLSQGPSAQMYNPKDGEPPPGTHTRFTETEWPLVVTEDGKGLQGTATLECFKDLKDELIIRMKGVRSEQVYSVWVTRKEGDVVERAQLFRGWDGDKAKDGKVQVLDNRDAYFRGCFTACPLGVWRNVEVRYHPDGKASDLTTSVVVLRARMRGE